MESVPNAGQVFPPLDEELELLPGGLTPLINEDLAHLATWMPFEKAAQMMKRMRGVDVSEATVRRKTEKYGALYETVQTEEVERIEKELPEAPAGPEKQLMSVDGAMVPLVGGEWAEVKTLVLGVIGEPVLVKGERQVHSQELSYFSRLADSETFARLSLVETHRRGVEQAQRVIAVADGAEWEQGFIDYHRPDAVRILDFPHAGEYVGRIGAAIWGLGTSQTIEWLKERLTRLKHQGPEAVLPELRELTAAHPEIEDLSGWLAYLEKREAHMQYPFYQQQGWPIGSGAVESGNKLVVEARLKGSGMHWAREHVNPMLSLRNAVCSDRWDEVWSQIHQQQLDQIRKQRLERSQQRLALLDTLADYEQIPLVDAPPQPVTSPAQLSSSLSEEHADNRPEPTRPRKPWRPSADHPWKKYPACSPSRRSKPTHAEK